MAHRRGVSSFRVPLRVRFWMWTFLDGDGCASAIAGQLC